MVLPLLTSGDRAGMEGGQRPAGCVDQHLGGRPAPAGGHPQVQWTWQGEAAKRKDTQGLWGSSGCLQYC